MSQPLQSREYSLGGRMRLLARLMQLSFFLLLPVAPCCVNAADQIALPLTVHSWDAMGSDRVLPFSRSDLGLELESLQIRLAPGEWEPASFVVRAASDLISLEFEVGNLRSANGVELSAGSVSVRVVKPWFQDGGRSVRRGKRRQLVPELLLHDDSLVRVDLESRQNFIRVEEDGVSRYVRISQPEDRIPTTAVVRDSDVMQPFSLRSKERREIWLTTHVDSKTLSGVYEGSLRIRVDGAVVRAVHLSVEVLPFELEAPALQYGIYYRGQLISRLNEAGRVDTINGEPVIRSARWKSEAQYRRELRDIAEHGMDYPTLYHYSWKDLKGVERALPLREAEGFELNELYVVGISVGAQKTRSELARLESQVSRWLSSLKRLGVGTVFFYGIDEAEGEILASQRASWSAVRRVGGRVFTAIKAGNSNLVGDVLDVAVVAYDLDPQEARRYHEHGGRIYSYANPQAGVEDPSVYRSNYGFRLWSAGYDGCMLFAYQYGLRRRHGDIWNDFDGSTRYREILFTYPTDGDIVSTVQWEGLREGVDDVRYLSTLMTQIAALPPGRTRLEAQSWLRRLGMNRSPSVVRFEIIEKILELQSVELESVMDTRDAGN